MVQVIVADVDVIAVAVTAEITGGAEPVVVKVKFAEVVVPAEAFVEVTVKS